MRINTEPVAAFIEVPAHIRAIANAVAYDLLHGPSYLLLPGGEITNVNDDCVATFRDDLDADEAAGDLVEETYVGKAAIALRGFLDEMPTQLWLDTESDCVQDTAPEGEEVDGEWCEPFYEDFVLFERREIIEAVFGSTIAREFH